MVYTNGTSVFGEDYILTCIVTIINSSYNVFTNTSIQRNEEVLAYTESDIESSTGYTFNPLYTTDVGSNYSCEVSVTQQAINLSLEFTEVFNVTGISKLCGQVFYQ